MAENSSRVVLDTNILISALLYQGKPGEVLDLALNKQISAVYSPSLLAELSEILVKKFNFSEFKLRQIERKVKGKFEIVYPQTILHVLKDVADNRVLEAALEGGCDFIVTGDKELLKLGNYQGIRILTADQFLKTISS